MSLEKLREVLATSQGRHNVYDACRKAGLKMYETEEEHGCNELNVFLRGPVSAWSRRFEKIMKPYTRPKKRDKVYRDFIKSNEFMLLYLLYTKCDRDEGLEQLFGPDTIFGSFDWEKMMRQRERP